MKFLLSTIIIGLLFIFFYRSLSAQTIEKKKYETSKPPFTKLKVGDTMVNISLGQVYNKNIKEKCISDFRGKLLILDFWSNTCKACIKAFPSMETVQNHFGNQIQILGVGVDYMNKGAVLEFINKRKGTKLEMQLPTIIRSSENDTLNSLFDLTPLPRHVWVNQEGIIVAITMESAVSIENVEAILKGQKLNFEPIVKKHNLKNGEPLFLNLEQFMSGKTAATGAAFGGYIDSLVPYSLRIDSSESYARICAINCPIEELFKISNDYRFSGGQSASEVLKRIHLDPNLKTRFTPNKELGLMNYWERAEYKKNNLFCYELCYPKNALSFIEAKEKMNRDLEDNFKVKVKLDTVLIDCLILNSMPGKKNLIPFASGKTSESDFIDSISVSYKNVNMPYIIGLLNGVYNTQPLIVDESGIVVPLDVVLPIKRNRFAELQTQLNKYGLELVQQQRSFPILIIEDNSN